MCLSMPDSSPVDRIELGQIFEEALNYEREFLAHTVRESLNLHRHCSHL